MQEEPTFAIRETRDGASVRLELLGELDLATLPRFRERLVQLRDERVPVSIDLSELDFMDSTGLAVLYGAAREAESDGWRLDVLPDLSPQVAHLLETAGVRAMIVGIHAGPHGTE